MVWWPGADSHRPQWEAQRVRGNHQSDLWPRWGGPVARVRNIRDSEVAGVCTELRAHITMGGRCCSAQGTTLHSMWGIHSMGVGGLWLVAGCQRCLVSLLRCSPKPVSFWPQGGEKWKDGDSGDKGTSGEGTVYLWEYLGASWVQRLKLIDFTPYGIQSKTRL